MNNTKQESSTAPKEQKDTLQETVENQETETPKKTAEKKPVQTDNSEMKEMREQIQQSNHMLQEAMQTIEILKKASDKKALERATPIESDGSIEIRVSTYRPDSTEEPKLVTSWKTVKNEVSTHKGQVYEDQVYEITLHDDTKVRLGDNKGYKEFFESLNKEPVQIPEEDIEYLTIKKDGKISIEGIKEVKVPWGNKKYTLSSKFIN